MKLKKVTKIINGFAFKSKDFNDLNGIPIVKIKSLKDQKVVIDESAKVSESFLNLDKKFHINKNDILIALTGSHITLPASAVGRVAKSRLNKTLLLNQRVGKFHVNEETCNHDFLFYFLTTDYFFENIGLRARGASNQANISSSDIGDIKINLPPLKTQRQIASILSAYDDLIENNLKRIALLEEQAQQTYEEWFVRLKFPGYEDVKIDAESGLPEGWEKIPLKQIAEMKFGYAFKANQFNSDGLGKPIIRIRNIPSSQTKDFTTEIVDKKYVVKKGDLLIGMDGEFYVNNWSGHEAYLVQRVCNLRAKKEIHKGLLTEAIKHPIKIFQASIDGATVAHLGKKHLDQITIVIPSNLDVSLFTHLLNQKINLSTQNHLLKEARDILLPRLMSGMINVDDLLSEDRVYDLSEDKLKIAAEPPSYYESKLTLEDLFPENNLYAEVACMIAIENQINNIRRGKTWLQKTSNHLKEIEKEARFKNVEFTENHWGMFSAQVAKATDNNPYLHTTILDNGAVVYAVRPNKHKDLSQWMQQPENISFVAATKAILKLYKHPLINNDLDRIELLNTVLRCMQKTNGSNLKPIRGVMQKWTMKEQGYANKAEKFNESETLHMIHFIKMEVLE